MKRMENIYVMGMGRSGTTMLQNMLHGHSKVVAPPETFFLLHLYGKYSNITNWDDDVIRSFIDDLYTDRPFRLLWNIPKSQVRASLDAMRPISSYAEACNAAFISYDNCHRKDIWVIVDKNPIYALFIPRLLHIHPEAKIIHITRDPRGCIASQMKTFKKKNIVGLARQWCWINQNIRACQKQGHKYLAIRYEDMVTDTDKILMTICNFLELDHERSMKNYGKSVNKRVRSMGSAFESKHKNLLQDIKPSLSYQWQEILTENQEREINTICDKEARHYGYSLEEGNLPSTYKRLTSFAHMHAVRFGARSFFALPFSVRKKILAIRSKLGDHKYQTDEQKSSSKT